MWNRLREQIYKTSTSWINKLEREKTLDGEDRREITTGRRMEEEIKIDQIKPVYCIERTLKDILKWER